jgi:DNA-binding LytR/AlgR family response regulator
LEERGWRFKDEADMSKDEKLKIGLCDDEKAVHDLISGILDSEYVLIHYFSGEELLEGEEILDCLLLDIDMPEMDGIEVARHLNRRGVSYRIIMLTSKSERFKEAFEINAFRFVTKPVDEKELRHAIEDVYHRMLGTEKVKIYKEGKAYTVSQKEIVFIMANRYSTIIYTAQQEFRSEKSLVQWAQILEPKLFYQCHKSYIVNLARVIELENAYVRMSTGEKVAVSRRKWKDLQMKYMDYDVEYR